MISATAVASAHRFWTTFFGCAEDELIRAGTHVVAHAGLAGYMGLWAFRCGKSCIISTPAEYLGAIKMKVVGKSAEAIYGPEALITAIEPLKIERIIGPCYIGYADTSTLRVDPKLLSRAAIVPATDHKLSELRDGCGVDWETAGIELDSGQPIFGCFDDGKLAAAASYEVWGNALAHLCVLTAPAYRGRGLAKSAAVAASVECA